jgi:tetratricopeptide (TPR) repeat protein
MFLRWGFAAICLAMFQGLAQQPPAVQLQKGLYSQNAAGNLDAAIQKYRQILASNPSERPVAAQAQYRLAQALLQKGDLSGAAQEFQTLAVNYPESKDLIGRSRWAAWVRGPRKSERSKTGASITLSLALNSTRRLAGT